METHGRAARPGESPPVLLGIAREGSGTTDVLEDSGERLRDMAEALGIAPQLRALWRFLRHGPDRLLHPLRRRRAEARLREGPVRRILVVCSGNICRSPYAAASLQRRTETWEAGPIAEVRSVGLVGPGRRSPAPAREVAGDRGVDLGGHRSRLMQSEDVAWADLVLVMTQRHRTQLLRVFGAAPEDVLLLGDLDPEPIRRRAIRDPVEQPAEVFRQVYRRIDRCIWRMAAALAPGGGTGRTASSSASARFSPNRARGDDGTDGATTDREGRRR